jgi:hypothetical protein
MKLISDQVTEQEVTLLLHELERVLKGDITGDVVEMAATSGRPVFTLQRDCRIRVAGFMYMTRLQVCTKDTTGSESSWFTIHCWRAGRHEKYLHTEPAACSCATAAYYKGVVS